MQKIVLVLIISMITLLLFGCTQPPVCGDGICNENSNSCPQDCLKPPEESDANTLNNIINSFSIISIDKNTIQSNTNGLTCNAACDYYFRKKCIIGYRFIENPILDTNTATQRTGIVSCDIANGPENTGYVDCLCSNETGLNCNSIDILGSEIQTYPNGITCDSYLQEKGYKNNSCIGGYREIINDSNDYTINTQRTGIISHDIASGPANTKLISCVSCEKNGKINENISNALIEKFRSSNVIEIKKDYIEQQNGVSCKDMCNTLTNSNTCLFGYRDVEFNNPDYYVGAQRDEIIPCNVYSGPLNTNYLQCYCSNS